MTLNIGQSAPALWALFVVCVARLGAVFGVAPPQRAPAPDAPLTTAAAARTGPSRAALRRSAAGPGCPGVPAHVAATPAAAAAQPMTMQASLGILLRQEVAAVGDLEHVLFDLLEGPAGPHLLVLASDVPRACELLQHGADVGTLLQRASLGLAPLPADGSLVLGLRAAAAEGAAALFLAQGRTAGGAADALRRALLAGEADGATAVAIAAGHPLELAAADPGRVGGPSHVGHPCPGLTPYVRSWVQSLPTGRPAPVAKRRRAP